MELWLQIEEVQVSLVRERLTICLVFNGQSDRVYHS